MSLFSMRRFGALASGNSHPGHFGCRVSLVLICASVVPACLLGCGMAASPQPPSLQLAKPVRDLAAVRVGDRVTLRWTTPIETTDKLKIKIPVAVRICREISTAPCENIATITGTPGKPAEYVDGLPRAMATGPLRAITYTVVAVNKHGRSAGFSNRALSLAGQAPPLVQNLSATMIERGVVLRWTPVANLQPNAYVRLRRTLLNPAPANSETRGGLPSVSESVEQTLQIAPASSKRNPGTALDTSAVFNRKYQYVAERIIELKVGGDQLQVASAPSSPTTIFTRDTFPPAVPAGLAAVPISAAINDGKPEVDLSWSASTAPDVAQYFVYRRDAGPETSAANPSTSQRIATENPDQPIVAPAFRDIQVQSGHTYGYSVVAVDNTGNSSPKSAEVVVTVPGS